MRPVTYILYSEKLNKFYIGYSENFEQRIQFHNSDENAKWTKSGRPWVAFLVIECTTKKEAMTLERYIKSQKSKDFIERLKNDEQAIKEILLKIQI